MLSFFNITLFFLMNGATTTSIQRRSQFGDQNVMKLYRYLLHDYNNEVRPVVHPKTPINVTFVFSLTQIIDVDERNQILTTNSWVRLHWQDYKLVWDPCEFANVTKMHIPSDKIWKPDIILYNNADAQYTKSVMSTDVIVDYLGNIHWPLSAIFTSSCPLDVKHYPFDRQTCLLKYASWAYDGTKIDLHLKSEEGDVTNYITNTEWNLIGIKAKKDFSIYSCCPEPYPFIDVLVTIERRAMFYVFNLILPCVLISLIALMGFYMPTDSGEKVTLGITSLLSTTVFLMLVAEGMPPTAEALPLIGIYYGVTIMLVALATAMTVFTVNIHHNGVHGYPVPPFLQIFAFRYLSKILFVRIEPYHSITAHVRHMYQKEHPNECKLSAGLQIKRINDCEDQLRLRRDESSISIVSANVHCDPNDRLLISSSSTPQNTTPLPFRATLSARNTDSPKKKKVSFSSLNEPPTDSPIYGRKVGRQHRGTENNENKNEEGDEFEREFLRVMSMVHGIIERNEMRVAERDKRDAIALEWQQVAMVLDRFLLVVFLIGTSASTFVILNQRNLFDE
ncbi:unnamed protein product [Caenorhabditis angaria]|uniref:Uncharacterized protein n=1 Tax=Caenorhabditis angaria TaxID=860376 RepID=A0A9P1IJB9_9PELO|nr:unnamed protein product [Caenorhabditis angaria]